MKLFCAKDLLAGRIESDSNGVAERLKNAVEPNHAGRTKKHQGDDGGERGEDEVHHEIFVKGECREPRNDSNSRADDEREGPKKHGRNYANEHRRRTCEFAREADAYEVLLYCKTSWGTRNV